MAETAHTAPDKTEALDLGRSQHENIKPPEGYLGFFPLCETPQERADATRSPFYRVLDRESVARLPYVLVPRAYLVKTGLLDEEQELERNQVGYNVAALATVRRQMRSAIESRLLADGWVHQQAFLPSRWYAGRSDAFRTAFLVQTVEDHNLRQSIVQYELGPGVHDPFVASDTEKLHRTTRWDVGRLNDVLGVQYHRFDSTGEPNSGQSWVDYYGVKDAFAVIGDQRGQWVVRKNVDGVRRYLYARFGAMIDLRGGNIVVLRNDRVGEIIGKNGSHIKRLQDVPRDEDRTIGRLKIVQDADSFTQLRDEAIRNGWIDEHFKTMADYGYVANPVNTADRIPGHNEVVGSISQSFIDGLAQAPNGNRRKDAQSNHPYSNYQFETCFAPNDMEFTDAPDFTPSAVLLGSWVQVVTNSGSVYTYRVLTLQTGGMHVIGTWRRTRDVMSRPFVGFLQRPTHNAPLVFSELSTYTLESAARELRELQYADPFIVRYEVQEVMLGLYGTYGEAWGTKPLDFSTVMKEYLRRHESTPVRSIRIGHRN